MSHVKFSRRTFVWSLRGLEMISRSIVFFYIRKEKNAIGCRVNLANVEDSEILWSAKTAEQHVTYEQVLCLVEAAIHHSYLTVAFFVQPHNSTLQNRYIVILVWCWSSCWSVYVMINRVEIKENSRVRMRSCLNFLFHVLENWGFRVVSIKLWYIACYDCFD